MDGNELQRSAKKRQKVLIVDDIEINRIVLSEILKEDYDIIEATDGYNAISVLFNESPKPDLALLDIMMPEMDGFEVLSVMKNSPLTAHIPVIFITANTGTESELKGLQLGAVDYITKPFVAEIVKLRVHNCIELESYRVSLEREVEKKVQELMHAKENMLEVLASIIEYRDVVSGEHVRRTTTLTEILINEMLKHDKFYGELNRLKYKVIITAAPIHDIGKIAIPDNILLKPGRLTPEEFEIVKKHTIIGEKIIHFLEREADDAYFQHCHDICLYHHERWDGKGYPYGLKGTEIPLSARILAVVDVFDALTSERPYKAAYDKPTALQMIVEGKGTQFDPDLIDILLSVSDKL